MPSFKQQYVQQRVFIRTTAHLFCQHKQRHGFFGHSIPTDIKLHIRKTSCNSNGSAPRVVSSSLISGTFDFALPKHSYSFHFFHFRIMYSTAIVNRCRNLMQVTTFGNLITSCDIRVEPVSDRDFALVTFDQHFCYVCNSAVGLVASNAFLSI